MPEKVFQDVSTMMDTDWKGCKIYLQSLLEQPTPANDGEPKTVK